MICLPSSILADLLKHARSEAPIEACGLLAGTDSTVRKSYRLTNCDASPEHFSLDPREQFAVLRDARASGMDLLAVYHSHPASPARMSDEDLRLALTPGLRSVIVSLQNPDQPQIKAFSVIDGSPVEEEVWVQG